MSPPSTDLVGAWPPGRLPLDRAAAWNAGEVLFREAGAWQAGEALFRDPLVKYNPFHDELGRFASGDGDGGGLSISAGDDLVGEPVGAGGGPKALTADDLPEGYTLVQEGKNDWVVYHGGDAVVFGASPEGTLANYANNWPEKMAPGMTSHLDTDDPHNDKPYEIKDATGEVKGKGASYAEALSDAKANGVTLGQQSIVGQLGKPAATPAGLAAGGIPTSITPGVSSMIPLSEPDLPFGYKVVPGDNSEHGGYEYWVKGPAGGGMMGGGATPEAAVADFINSNPQHLSQMLPPGLETAEASDGSFEIYNPKDKLGVGFGATPAEALANLKYNQQTGQTGDLTPPAPAAAAPTPTGQPSAYTPEQLAGVVSEHGFVAGDLGHGAKLVQSGDDWIVQTKSGGTSGVGKTPAEALESHFVIYPSHALGTGASLQTTLDGTGFNVVDSETNDILGTGATKFEAVADWKQKTMVGEAPPNLGDLPETRFGTGAGGGPEELATAGGVGFGIADERDRGHDYANQKYDPNAPIAPAATHHVTHEEANVIESYTGSGNNDINHSLRYGTPPDYPSTTPGKIKTLDGLFRDTATAKATTLYRGIGEHEKQRLEEAIKAGRGHYVDKGFVSTSSSESFAQSWKSGDYIEFHLPPGSPAINVDPHSSHHGEHEWIINRNQIFKFDDGGKVTTFGYGEHKKYTVHLVDQRPPSAKDGEGQLKLPFTPVNNLGKARRKPPSQPYDPADKFSYIGGEIDYLDDDEVNALIRRQQRQPKPATETKKYNEAHDERGRFASGEGGGGGNVDSGIASGRELSPDEKKTAGYYTAANGYLTLNHYLRHDVMSELSFGGRTTEAHVAALAGAIDSRRLTADTTLYRGFHDSRLVDRLDQMWEQKRGAKEFVDKGFVSTSESVSVASTYFTGGKGEGQYVFAIHAPKGTKALDVSRLKLGSPLEMEVILQHGSRFRLDGRERDPSGKTTYKLSLLGAAAKWNPFHDLLGRFASGDGGGAAASAPKEYEDPVGTDAPTIPGQDHSKFSFVEKSALSAYTGGSYLQVNNYFRKGRVLSEATATFIERMDSGFAKVAPLAAPMEVYRGLSDHTMARFEQAFAGKDAFEVTDLGYGSTSTSRATAASFGGGAMSNELGLARPGAVATITLPAGSKAMDMVPLSGAPGEQEVLVDRGARYRVERNHGDSFGKYKMTLLDQQVKKANPNHDERGRFAEGPGGSGGGGLNTAILGALHDKGGFTFNPVTVKAPHHGLAVGGYGSRDSYAAASFSLADVKAYLSKNAAALKDKYLGGWIDKGKVYLDVTKVFPAAQRMAAIAAGYALRRGQIAIANLGALNAGRMDEAFINTGGTGKAAGARTMFLLDPRQMSAEEIYAALLRMIDLPEKK